MQESERRKHERKEHRGSPIDNNITGTPKHNRSDTPHAKTILDHDANKADVVVHITYNRLFTETNGVCTPQNIRNSRRATTLTITQSTIN